MSKLFEILPHTADVRIKVFGKTKKELFKNALSGMAEIQKKESEKSKGQTLRVKIKIQSPDINALLVDFLSEILYQSQINRAIFKDAEFLKFSDNEIEGEISGFKVDAFDKDIKAATYHELDIKKFPGGIFETIIVFDV